MSYSFDPSGQNVSLPTEEEAEELSADFRAAHPYCLECQERVCPYNDDGTIRDGHFDCDEMDGEAVPGGFVHKACKQEYVTYQIRDEIRAALLVRRGAEINELVAAERANNACLRVYEKLRELGIAP